ncbi:MAG TPA: methyltransferase [Flavobacteriales bacterium]|jgi:caffeoyl-CoA O-methyltransferase|nr:class I SAM-dependent methyltransferase [Flavobacteriales bacterium]MDB9701209.1 O-methyltransferase [Salibacteraceae bacterium]HAW19960.1 methyltransferase [Flavobacteriales bacterium]
MEFLPEEIDQYCQDFTENESELLLELNRFTHNNVLQPRMLAGHLQGRVLSMLSHMISPKIVVEIGTYTGYSALCWAEGLSKDGAVHTIEINDELENKILSFVDRSPYKSQIKLHIGRAADILNDIHEEIDVVYIDADKENYAHYYNQVIDRVKPGGYIIADNVLWSGKVTGKPEEMDVETRALYDYSEMIQSDERVQNVLFPIRDGLMIARKK